MATIGRLVVQIGADVGGLTAGLQTAQSKLKGFGSQMKSVGTGLTLGLSAPIVGIAAAALNSASGFESSMNLMQATTGATGAQMQILQAQALNLGAVTSFSAGEAADAMLELAKAGMNVEQVGAAIPGVMDLAAAGGLGLADAAMITSNAINAFGLEAGAATSVANSFAAAANASSADVGDLAQGFQMAGAVFASNGQSVDTLNASLSILSNNGIAGSDAGTSLKTMMMRLTAPTAKAAGVMNDLGLQVYDATGAMLPFGQIVGQLETATGGLSDAQRNTALSTIFGADAIRAATILAGEGSQTYIDMMNAVTKQGAASEMAGARMKGLGGAIEYFKGSVDSLLIGAALPFLDTLGSMVRRAADLMTGFTTLSPSVQRFAAVLLGVLAVAGPLLMILGTMATALAALLSPIGLAIAGLVLLGVAIAANWGRISSVVARGAKAAQPALNAIVDTVSRLRSGDLTFSELGAGIVAQLQQMPGKIQAWASSVDWGGLLDSAAGMGIQIFSTVQGWFTSIDWAGMLGTATGAASGLAAAVGNWFASIDWVGGAARMQGGLQALRDAVLTKLGSIDWAGGAAKVEGGFALLRMAVMAKLASIDWAGGAAKIETGLTGLRDSVMSKLSSIDWQGGIAKAGAFLSGLDAWRDGLMSQVTSRIGSFDWSSAAGTFSGWVEGLSGQIKSMDLSGIDWAGFLSGKMLGPISTALSALKFVMGADAFESLKSSVTTGISAIDWAGVADSMWDLGTAIGGQVFNMGIDLVGDVSQKINDIDWGALSVDFAGMVSWVAGKIGTIDWAGAGFDIGNALISLSSAVGGAIAEIDWGALFGSGADLLGSAGQATLDIGGGLLTAVSEKINSVDWAAASVDFSSMVTELTTKVQETDWSSLGSNVGTKLRTMFENTFSAEGANPLSSLALSLRTAVSEIEWGDIGTSLAGFAEAAKTAVGGFVTGVMAGLGVDMTALTWPEFPDWKAWDAWDAWNAWLAWLPWNSWNDWLAWHPWNPFPAFSWPEMPSFSWPAAPGWWPSWLGGGVGHSALGTANWQGGLSWVGERGPELVNLPKGARVWSNRESMNMLAGAGAGGQPITVGPNYITQEIDEEALLYRLATKMKRRGMA